jgi:F-type H+-transporting ATPase subunit delta
VAVESSVVSGIAARYATALFELASDANAVEAVNADLARLESLLEQSADLARMVRSPAVDRADQGRAMAAVMERAGIGKQGGGDLAGRFVGVLTANRRLFALNAAIRRFRALRAAQRGETSVAVHSAAPLGEAQLAALKSLLSKAVGHDVAIETRHKPDLIGGLVVQVGSRMYDASVKNKLARMRAAMKQ